MSFSVIVLAAGRGTRMGSKKPKVLQTLAGKPLLHHVLDMSQKITPKQTLVVCGYEGELLQANCKEYNVDWAWQHEQLGTGHAVQCAIPELQVTDRILVLCGDVPLIEQATIEELLAETPENHVGMITAKVDEPGELGRIVRDKDSRVQAIVEARDASYEQLKIQEINAGIYLFPYKDLQEWLSKLQSTNQQQEFYLTDVIAMAVAQDIPIVTKSVVDEISVVGVNSQQQLLSLERRYQQRIADKLLSKGVKIYDATRLDVRGDVVIGSDVTIDVNVILQGTVTIESGVTIGPNVVITNSYIASGTTIYANSVIDAANIGVDCKIGPFARIRPGTKMQAESKIGNFVEVKNVSIDKQTKINHLSYVGDTQVGCRVNIGAGVITCNYDGANKHTTIIEDDAFVGSNSELIAPVTVGKGATIAAGTTLTKNAPPNTLTLTKKVLNTIINWGRPIKQKEGT